MKVFIHIEDDCQNIDWASSPFVEVEMPYAPEVGDTLWLNDEFLDELKDKIVQLYKEKQEPMYGSYLYGMVGRRIATDYSYWENITPDMFAKSLNLEDATHVIKRLANLDTDNVLPVGLHVFFK